MSNKFKDHRGNRNQRSDKQNRPDPYDVFCSLQQKIIQQSKPVNQTFGPFDNTEKKG